MEIPVYEVILVLILCHAVGDYVLQSDYIAKNKSSSTYILLIHCALYIIPFAIVFNLDYRLLILFVLHTVVDYLKIYKIINLLEDQCTHYIVAIILYTVL